MIAEEAMKHPVGPMPTAPTPGAAAAAAARGGTLLQQQMLMQQQQQQRVRQLQLRGRYGFVPSWMSAASAPAHNLGVLSFVLAAAGLFLLF